MEFRVLQYFLTIAQEKSISRAAEILHLTQPTLSRQIAQLEAELGMPLFIRGKKATLTEAGIMLRRKAEEVVSLIGMIKEDFRSRQDVAGEIRIGSGIYAGSNDLFAALPSFMKKFPKVHFDIYTASADLLKERLDHGLLDFAVLQEPIDIGSYNFIRLPAADEWGLLMAGTHPLAQKTAIEKADLPGTSLMMSRRAVLQGEFKNWLGQTSGLSIRAVSNLNANMLPFLQDGRSCYLCLRGSTRFYDPVRLSFVPLSPKLVTTTVFVWKKTMPLFGAAGEFLKYVETLHLAASEPRP